MWQGLIPYAIVMVIRIKIAVYSEFPYICTQGSDETKHIFLQGRIFGRRVRSIALELSSNSFQCTIGSSKKTSKPNVFISLNDPIIGIKYLNDCDSKTYLDSVEDRANVVCSL